ncbi:MAG: AAA family ATPase [Clostridium sp.]
MKEGKIITCWSPRGNMGTTLTAINSAMALTKYGETILIDFNLIQPRISQYLNLPANQKSIDDLYPFAIGGKFSKEIVIANCDKVENLYVLKGTVTPSLDEFVSQDILEGLLNGLKNDFDYIVLDTHTYLSNPGTYTALNMCDIAFTMMHKDVYTSMALHDLSNYIFQLFNKDKFVLIFNQESEEIHMKIADIVDIVKLPLGGTLPKVNDAYNLINQGNTPNLIKEKSFKGYFQSLDKIIKENITREKQVVEKTKKKKFNFFSKKN